MPILTITESLLETELKKKVYAWNQLFFKAKDFLLKLLVDLFFNCPKTIVAQLNVPQFTKLKK